MKIRFVAMAAVLALAGTCGCGKNGGGAQPPTGGSPSAETFNSGIFSSSSSVRVYVRTFSTAGSFGYHCTVHGGSMPGAVEVNAMHPDSAFVTIGDDFFSPSPARIKPGGYVKWIATGGSHGISSN